MKIDAIEDKDARIRALELEVQKANDHANIAEAQVKEWEERFPSRLASLKSPVMVVLRTWAFILGSFVAPLPLTGLCALHSWQAFVIVAGIVSVVVLAIAVVPYVDHKRGPWTWVREGTKK